MNKPQNHCKWKEATKEKVHIVHITHLQKALKNKANLHWHKADE